MKRKLLIYLGIEILLIILIGIVYSHFINVMNGEYSDIKYSPTQFIKFEYLGALILLQIIYVVFLIFSNVQQRTHHSSENDFDCEFELWRDDLKRIYFMLAFISGYKVAEDEVEKIKLDVFTATDYFKDIWSNYTLKGEKYEIRIQLAFDPDSEYVFIRINAPQELQEQVKLIQIFLNQLNK